MGPLDQFSAFAVARMRGRFEPLAGRPVEFSASGFWLLVADDPEYRNDAVKTTDVMLVSALPFSGSSGSPVLAIFPDQVDGDPRPHRRCAGKRIQHPEDGLRTATSS